MAEKVSASFPDRPSAERGVADLQTAGFPDARIGMASQVRTGPTDVKGRLAPNRRSVTGAVIGSLVVGTIGFILGWLFIQILPGISHGGMPAAAGAWATAVAGGIVGWLIGALVATRAPVEEGYYRARRQEAGSTRVEVEAAGREDEARAILRRAGGQDIARGGEAQGSGQFGPDSTRGALT